MSDPLTPETQALLDEVSKAIEEGMKKYIGEIEPSLGVFTREIKKQLHGLVPWDVSDAIEFTASTKGSEATFAPANFYTALVVGCSQLDIHPMPIPSQVLGDSWTCDQGTFTWRDKKLFFTAPLPMDHIDITFSA